MDPKPPEQSRVGHRSPVPTCRDNSLHTSAVDEGSLDGLGAHIRPVNALLQGIIVHHRDVIDVRHREGDDVVVVGVVNVHTPDLHLPRVQQELLKLWGKERDGAVVGPQPAPHSWSEALACPAPTRTPLAALATSLP